MQDGEWIEAPPIPGTLVLNIAGMLCKLFNDFHPLHRLNPAPSADLFSRWTNGRFVSTCHRVVNTTGHARYSVPVFFGPSYDTLISALPSCIPVGEKPKYPPILSGEVCYRSLVSVHVSRTQTLTLACP